MKGLGKRLRGGILDIDPAAQRLLIRSRAGDVLDSIPYQDLGGPDWGYVYEAFVAQELNDRGYDVQYVGLSAGYTDGGIDLVARRASETAFVQCKYMMESKINPQRMERLLYSASSFIQRSLSEEKCQFWLVVPSLERAFSRRKSKNGKSSFPLIEYFLSKNDSQSRVQLLIHEIPMPR
jgi:Holliday junction resolvase-like predicted endonuclease